MKLQLEECLQIVCDGVSSSIANNSGFLQDVLVNTHDYSAITFQQHSIELNSSVLQPTKNNVLHLPCSDNRTNTNDISPSFQYILKCQSRITTIICAY